MSPAALVRRVNRRGRQRGSLKRRRRLTALLYLLPMLVLLLGFTYVPIVRGLIYAFESVNLVEAAKFAGFDKFRLVIDDPAFWPAWRNTLEYTALIVFFANLVPLAISLAIHEFRTAHAFFRMASILPMMMPPVVSALLFNWLFDPEAGFLNSLLGHFGIGKQNWLQSSSESLPSVAAVAIWGSWGLAAMIYLAALQQISPELYEAAEIDGAGVWSRIRHITLPQVRGQVLLLVLLGVISASQIFTQPYVLTQGGPANASVSVVQLVYRYAFQFGDLGAASALSVMLLGALVVFSGLYAVAVKRLARV